MQKFFDCGIDLGTTNSCIAKPTDDNWFSVIENTADRMNVTPSAVCEDKRGRLFCGQRAYNSIDEENLSVQFKRWMGEDATKTFESGREMSAIELSAEILKSLKRDAETRYGEDVKDVVITVPAAFSSLQCAATNEAAKLTGFRNVELLQEPIAAAIAYGVKPDAKDKYWMVFDYGGGTLDVAIISTHDGRLRVINCAGDNYCGGSDINQLMYDKLIKPKLEEEYNISNFNKNTERPIVLSLERCKIELSSVNQSICEIFEIEDADGQDIEFEYEITRKELEDLITDTVEHCMKIARKALDDSGVPEEKIDKILLVGGSTFIPLVRQKLKENFKIEQDCSLDPMTVVAGGAAIYASSRVIEIEEEITEGNKEQAIIRLQYEPKSSEDVVNVIGTIENSEGKDIDRIKIDAADSECGGGLWTSGWVEFLDKDSGYFDIDVMLNRKNSSNRFKIIVCDVKGSEIECINDTFEIRHNETVLKNSSAPVNNSVCILAASEDGKYNILKPIIKKNTPLPAEYTEEFYTNKILDPSNEDILEINIYEGEEWDTPPANAWVHCVRVSAVEIGKVLPVGTKIEITMHQNESRINTFSGYIPDIDYILNSEELGKTEYKSLEDRMDEVEAYIKETEVTIRQLEERNIDVKKIKQELETIKDAFDEVYTLIDIDNDKVNLFMRTFYDFYSKVLKLERDTILSQKKADNKEQLEAYTNNANNYGNYSQQQKMSQLQSSYDNAQSDDDRNYYLEEMSSLSFDIITNNFDFLRTYFMVVLAKNEVQYTNMQQAEYWKSQAYEAIDDRNVAKLRNAVFKLLDLQVSSAGDSAQSSIADLRI